MSRNINADDAWVKKVNRFMSRFHSGANLENSSITNGRMRFIGGTLRVDSGGRVEIVGTLQIDGTTVVNGQFKIEGPWTFNGDGTIAGKVSITGNQDVTGSIRVLAGGRIQVGAITLDPSSNGGSMKFNGGPEVYAAGTTLSLYSGAVNGGFVELGAGSARINGGGARFIEVTPTGFRLVGIPTKTGTGLTPGLPWIDPDGTIYRITS